MPYLIPQVFIWELVYKSYVRSTSRVDEPSGSVLLKKLGPQTPTPCDTSTDIYRQRESDLLYRSGVVFFSFFIKNSLFCNSLYF